MTLAIVAIAVLAIMLLVHDMITENARKKETAEYEKQINRQTVRAANADRRAGQAEAKAMILEVQLELQTKQFNAKIGHMEQFFEEDKERIQQDHTKEMENLYKDYTNMCRKYENLKEAHERMIAERREVA